MPQGCDGFADAVDGGGGTGEHYGGWSDHDDHGDGEGRKRQPSQRGDGGTGRDGHRQHPDPARGPDERERRGDGDLELDEGGGEDDLGDRQRDGADADGGGDGDGGRGDPADAHNPAVGHGAERGGVSAATGGPAPGRQRQPRQPERCAGDGDGDPGGRHADQRHGDDGRDRGGDVQRAHAERECGELYVELRGHRAHVGQLRGDRPQRRRGDGAGPNDPAFGRGAERGRLRSAAGGPAAGWRWQPGEPGGGDGDGGDRLGWGDVGGDAHRHDDR